MQYLQSMTIIMKFESGEQIGINILLELQSESPFDYINSIIPQKVEIGQHQQFAFVIVPICWFLLMSLVKATKAKGCAVLGVQIEHRPPERKEVRRCLTPRRRRLSVNLSNT